jgi:hypothetical protein
MNGKLFLINHYYDQVGNYSIRFSKVVRKNCGDSSARV